MVKKTLSPAEEELNAAAIGVNPDTAVKAQKGEQRMLLVLPPAAPGQEETLAISVNGRLYLMDRGGEYMVPKAVYDEYQRAKKAGSRSHKRKKEMLRKEQAINAHADAVIAGKVSPD